MIAYVAFRLLLVSTTVMCTQTLLTPSDIMADYIIVGGGTTGLLLANRLSSDPSISVLIIDPGPDDRKNPSVTSIVNWQRNQGTSIDWAYPTTSQSGTADRSLTYRAGKIVGGTSMINGMAYIRADAAAIDAWEALGAEGWNWNAMWPYYKAVEHLDLPTDWQIEAGAAYKAEYHGESGSLHVGYPLGLANKTTHASVAKTWEKLLISTKADANGGNVAGFTVRPMTIDRDAGVRESAAKAFYYPIESRKNLRLVRGTVSRLRFSEAFEENRSVCAVEYIDSEGQARTAGITLRGEIVMAAGSLRTPQILEASGIGDPKLLSSLGIKLEIDLPGVGKNLQDQPNISLSYQAKQASSGLTTYATFATAADVFEGKLSQIER